MAKTKIEGEILQSYFENICNSIYFAYEQIKRIEVKQAELAKSSPEDVLEVLTLMVEKPLPEDVSENLGIKKEKIISVKEQYEALRRKYKEEYEELAEEKVFWQNEINSFVNNLLRVIRIAENLGFSFIIYDREQVISILKFYESNYHQGKFIDVSEKGLRFFPEDEMSKAFLEAYKTGKVEEIWEVKKEYY